jgi:hypothetical protein
MRTTASRFAATAAPNPGAAKFPLGEVIVSPGAAKSLSPELIARVLARHQAGDWGDLLANGVGDNNDALRLGGPVVSRYFKRLPAFRITTSADRMMTKIEMEQELLFARRS